MIRRNRQAPFSPQGPILGVERTKEEIGIVQWETGIRLGGQTGSQQSGVQSWSDWVLSDVGHCRAQFTLLKEEGAHPEDSFVRTHLAPTFAKSL